MKRLALVACLAAATCGCAIKGKPLPTLRYPNDPVAGVRVYKVGTSKRADQLIKWTNHYTNKLSLPEADIIFQTLPHKWCGLALPPTQSARVLIAYDLSKWCALSLSARDAAIHEVCHHYLKHTTGERSELTGDAKLKHVEVDICIEQHR